MGLRCCALVAVLNSVYNEASEGLLILLEVLRRLIWQPRRYLFLSRHWIIFHTRGGLLLDRLSVEDSHRVFYLSDWVLVWQVRWFAHADLADNEFVADTLGELFQVPDTCIALPGVGGILSVFGIGWKDWTFGGGHLLLIILGIFTHVVSTFIAIFVFITDHLLLLKSNKAALMLSGSLILLIAWSGWLLPWQRQYSCEIYLQRFL